VGWEGRARTLEEHQARQPARRMIIRRVSYFVVVRLFLFGFLFGEIDRCAILSDVCRWQRSRSLPMDSAWPWAWQTAPCSSWWVTRWGSAHRTCIATSCSLRIRSLVRTARVLFVIQLLFDLFLFVCFFWSLSWRSGVNFFLMRESRRLWLHVSNSVRPGLSRPRPRG
jgi:hypothetical protein